MSGLLSGLEPQCVISYTMDATFLGDVSFAVGRDCDGRLVVKRVTDEQPLRRGDRSVLTLAGLQYHAKSGSLHQCSA